jgi:hypothetical protein
MHTIEAIDVRAIKEMAAIVLVVALSMQCYSPPLHAAPVGLHDSVLCAIDLEAPRTNCLNEKNILGIQKWA